MFQPNNVYPTLVYHKNLGVPGYKVVANEEEHRTLINSLEPDAPKMGRPPKKMKFELEE